MGTFNSSDKVKESSEENLEFKASLDHSPAFIPELASSEALRKPSNEHSIKEEKSPSEFKDKTEAEEPSQLQMEIVRSSRPSLKH